MKKHNLGFLVITCSLLLLGNQASSEYVQVPGTETDSYLYEDDSILHLLKQGISGRYLTVVGIIKTRRLEDDIVIHSNYYKSKVIKEKYNRYMYAIDCQNQSYNKTSTMFTVHKWRAQANWNLVSRDPLANEISNKYPCTS